MLIVMAIKACLKKFRWLEDHAAFMLSFSLIVVLAECSIFLSPGEFKITPL